MRKPKHSPTARNSRGLDSALFHISVNIFTLNHEIKQKVLLQSQRFKTYQNLQIIHPLKLNNENLCTQIFKIHQEERKLWVYHWHSQFSFSNMEVLKWLSLILPSAQGVKTVCSVMSSSHIIHSTNTDALPGDINISFCR